QGNPMDQNANGITGEPGDAFSVNVTVRNPGPFVTSQSRNGTVVAPIASIDLTFNEAMDAASVAVSDFTLAGPAGAITITGVSAVSATTVRVSFAAQTVSGACALPAGPDIRDIGGSPMNQDRDGND